MITLPRHLPRRPLSLGVAAALALAAGGLAAACSDGPTNPDDTPTPLPYTVSGTIANARGTAVPADARVVLVWSSDDGNGDYSYVWGSGAVDAATGRFAVTLAEAPPTAATFTGASGRLGVAFPVLVPAADAREGRVTDESGLADRALGADGQRAVLYFEGQRPDDWPGFRPGYNVGRGVPARAGRTFDTFEPTSASAMQLVVDALRNIRFVNWT